MSKENWHHACELSDEMCEIWHGWDRIMDYVVATQLPIAIAREEAAELLRGVVSDD